MRILFVHQNFPGQFKYLAPALAARGHKVIALGITGVALEGVPCLRYTVKGGQHSGVHPWLADLDPKVRRGEACARACHTLREKGFTPDLIFSNPGWGESIFLREVWPNAKIVEYLEFYYGVEGRDVGFDNEFGAPNWLTGSRLKIKNLGLDLAIRQMDAALSPTRWQSSTLPDEARAKTTVIFDGVDTAWIRPDPAAAIELEGQRFAAGEEIVTLINRNMEPYRGYHIFMRALPKILAARPNARVIIVGGDEVSYGQKAPEGKTWKSIFLDEVRDRIDVERVIYTGRVPHDTLVKLYQVSAAHVYLTYPFVLSWSCVEALAAGCLLIGSRTPPVEDFVEDGKNGLLVDFFDHDGLADRVIGALAEPEKYRPLREAARAGIVAGYDLHQCCLPKQIEFAESFDPRRRQEAA